MTDFLERAVSLEDVVQALWRDDDDPVTTVRRATYEIDPLDQMALDEANVLGKSNEERD